MSQDKQTMLQIDNTTLTTSLAFVNLCFLLILYLRGSNPPFGKETCDIMVVFFTIIYLAFLISAGFTFGDIIKYTKDYETSKIKCISFIVGLICFSLVTFVLMIKI